MRYLAASKNRRIFVSRESARNGLKKKTDFFALGKNITGFTMIELVIVLAITLILVAAAAPIYGNLQVSAQLNESTTQVIQSIRTAREYSAARLNDTAHGVYFNIAEGDDSVILYQGASYATRDSAYDRTLTLDSPLSVSTTLSGNEVNFSKGLAMPDNTGTITLTHSVDGTRSIIINAYGLVEQN